MEQAGRIKDARIRQLEQAAAVKIAQIGQLVESMNVLRYSLTRLTLLRS